MSATGAGQAERSTDVRKRTLDERPASSVLLFDQLTSRLAADRATGLSSECRSLDSLPGLRHGFVRCDGPPARRPTRPCCLKSQVRCGNGGAVSPGSSSPVDCRCRRVGVLVIAGCGSSTKPSATSQSATASPTAVKSPARSRSASKRSPPAYAQAQLKAAACIRSHGFPSFPDPTFGAGGAQVNLSANINVNSRSGRKGVRQARPGARRVRPDEHRDRRRDGAGAGDPQVHARPRGAELAGSDEDLAQQSERPPRAGRGARAARWPEIRDPKLDQHRVARGQAGRNRLPRRLTRRRSTDRLFAGTAAILDAEASALDSATRRAAALT